MEAFTITSRMTRKTYAGFLYGAIYKKPLMIVATLLGLYLLVTVALYYSHVSNYYSETPVFETVAGIFILSGPTLIVLMAMRGQFSNPSMQHDISYTFSVDGVLVKGLTFKSEYSWEHIIRLKETKHFLILYHSKKLANFADKAKLTPEQLQFVKSRVRKK